MILLALDSSQIQASACVLEKEGILAAETGSTSVAHSEGLLPLVERTLSASGKSLAEIDALAVGVGPGSFTGLRIGCATIKGFAQALDKPVLPFSSLRALALSVDSSGPDVVSMANAYQGQVFVGWTDPVTQSWKEDAVVPGEWAQRFGAGRENLGFCGMGAKIHWADLQIAGKEPVLLDTMQVNPRGICRAVIEKLQSPGGPALVRYDRLQANYMRPSQAEIKLLKV